MTLYEQGWTSRRWRLNSRTSLTSPPTSIEPNQQQSMPPTVTHTLTVGNQVSTVVKIFTVKFLTFILKSLIFLLWVILTFNYFYKNWNQKRKRRTASVARKMKNVSPIGALKIALYAFGERRMVVNHVNMM